MSHFFRHQKRFYYCAADDDEEPIVTGCPFVFNLFSMRNNILEGARLVHISIFFLVPSQLFNSTAPEEMLFPSYPNRLLAHQLLLKNQWRLRSSTQRKQANCKFTLSEFYGLGLEKSLEWSYRTRKELPQEQSFDWRLKSPGHSATEQQQKEVQTNEGKHLLVQIVTEAEEKGKLDNLFLMKNETFGKKHFDKSKQNKN